MLRAFLLVAAFCLSGCVIVPMPFTSDRSPQFRAKVVDAATRKPITGAHIWTVGNERKKVTTDSTGQFLLRPSKNIHLLFYANPSWGFGLPQGKKTNVLVVHAEGYSALTLDFSLKATWDKYVETETTKGYSLGPFYHQYLILKPLLLKRE